MSELQIAVVQYNIAWKEKATNFTRLETLLDATRVDLMVLPEMFQTGFCTDDRSIAEEMDGDTITWMMEQSKKCDSAICGSFLCKEEGHYYNRFVLISDREIVGHYDKTHLFGLGGETTFINAGNNMVDMVLKGFKIRTIVCYDLRFPYTSFNDSDYDVLLNVANWPSQRIAHWDALLHARAIENQVYVIGCNRVGEQKDNHGKSFYYPGHSSVYAPDGERMLHSLKEEVLEVTIYKKVLEDSRAKLPFIQDRRM